MTIRIELFLLFFKKKAVLLIFFIIVFIKCKYTTKYFNDNQN